jgi:hypothetical protein
MTTDLTVTKTDVAILREMATRFREIAEGPVNQERRRLWYQHDIKGERPLVLTETDGGIGMVLPDYTPRCQEPWAQAQEWGFVGQFMHHDVIGDDYPLEPVINVGWQISKSGYGVEQHVTRPQTEGTLGAYHIDAPIADLSKEIHRLQPRTFSVDREATLAQQAFLQEVYDGILPVRIRSNPWWTLGMTWSAILLIGLENLMLYMYDEPEPLHQLMAYLRDDHLALVTWMEREGLLCLNNENDYNGSGSRGYTRRLPLADWQPGQPVRTRDLWTLIESQETVGVGPDLYAEFIFPYENAIAERFGSVYYGCCEPVNNRWDVLKEMANLKRVSVSPWCDEAFMAANIGDRVYSRKPNPTLVSTEVFDEEAVRADLRTTLQLTHDHDVTVEVIMKDVHTLRGESDRLTRWTRIAREVIEEIYG